MPTWRREMTTDWDTGNTKSKSDGLTKFFDSVKAVKFPRLFKLRAKEINNLIVMLNASILAKILLCMGILVTYKDYFGQEIDCNVPEQKTMSKAKIDDYCWSEGIFVVPDSPPYQTSYPGITSLQVTDSQKVYLRYYPWVHVSLIFQAVMFYQAKFIWICMQDEKICKIFEKIVDKDVNIYELDELVRSNVVQRVADLLYTGGNFYYRVIMMEFICMCHLFTHIWLTDLFLGGNFHSLGFKWLQYNHGLIRVDEDPLRKIFPREAKCSIKRFGYSGGIEVFDGQCYILMNNVVEKIYLALWLVYHLFLLINMCVLIWRMVIFLCPFIRLASLQQTGSPQAAKKYRKLCGNAGNWYILHLLSTHLTASYFMDLIDSVVAQHYDSKRRPIYRSRFAEKARKLKKKSPTTPLTMEILLANNANSNDRQEDDSNKKYEPGPPVPIVWDGKIDGLWPEN